MTDTREKILATAGKLIYENGIHATGMDLLVKTSGVARKSIYRCFANKDDITAAALAVRDVHWMQWFRSECEKAETPQDRIIRIFTVLKSWFESDGFRGCAFINISGEVGDVDNPIRHIAKLHKQKLLDYTLELTKQLDIKDPDFLAKQFFVLIEGTMTVARVMGDYTALDNAREVAMILLNEVQRTSA